MRNFVEMGTEILDAIAFCSVCLGYEGKGMDGGGRASTLLPVPGFREWKERDADEEWRKSTVYKCTFN